MHWDALHHRLSRQAPRTLYLWSKAGNTFASVFQNGRSVDIPLSRFQSQAGASVLRRAPLPAGRIRRRGLLMPNTLPSDKI
jgi:hypothetical protein